jgi:hypothetical protein
VGNPQWLVDQGKVCGALAFDGKADYVRIKHNDEFNCPDGITVAAWIKINEIGHDYQAIVTHGGESWRLQRDGGTEHLAFCGTGLTSNNEVLGNISVNDGQWHHAAGVYDGQHLYLYIDGKLDNSVDADGKIAPSTSDVLIGENAQKTGRFWNGLIDDVRIYGYALPEDQIAGLAEVKPAAAAPQSPRQMMTVLIIILAAAGLVLWIGRRKKNTQ